MKKILCFAVFAALLCGMTGVTGCNAEAKKKTLKMATEATFPPYEYFENGKIVGIDAEIVGEIAKNLGYELQIMEKSLKPVLRRKS